MSRSFPRRELYVIALSLTLLALTAAAQPENWEYFHYKTPISLTLDDTMIAVYNPDDLPDETVYGYLAAVGLEEFEMTPGPGNWHHLTRAAEPQAPGRESVPSLIARLAARPDNPFYLSPVFRTPSNPDGFMYPSDQMSVGFEETMVPGLAEAELQGSGVGEILERNWLRTPNIFRAHRGSKSGIQLLRTSNTLAKKPFVRFASPSFVVVGPLTSACQTIVIGPNDEFFNESWGLQAISIEPAWRKCTGDPAVIAAVLGDGVDFHPDMWSEQVPLPGPGGGGGVSFGGSFYKGTDCTGECSIFKGPVCNSNCPGLPTMACARHETLVASVISSRINNGIGTAGVAPTVSLLPVRVGTYVNPEPDPNQGRECFARSLRTHELAAAIDWAAAAGARVTNLSWQTLENFSEVTEAYRRTYENDGVVHFNSAGNANRLNPQPPGGSSDPSIVIGPVNSVSGIDETGELFQLPNGAGSSHGPGIDFTAPGFAIFTADRTNDPTDTADSLGFRLSGCNPATDVDCCDPSEPDCFGGLYLKVPGTSFAVAYVTGVASLVISKRPELSAREVETVLRNTADDLGAPGYDEKFGHGLVNGQKALEYLESYIFADGFESGDALAWSSSVN